MLENLMNLIENASWADFWKRFGEPGTIIILACTIIPLLTAYLTSLAGRLSKRMLATNLGQNSQLVVGGLGILLHELGHAIFAVIFGHRLTHIRLLDFHYHDTGTLGSVEHRWETDNIYQTLGNFFIGLAPYYSCSLALFGCQWLIFHKGVHFSSLLYVNTLASWQTFTTTVWQTFSADFHVLATGNLFQWVLYLILIIMVASTGYDLSGADMKNTVQGIVPFVLLQIVVTVFLGIFQFSGYVIPYLTIFAIISFVFMLRSLIYILVSLAFLSIFWFLNRHTSVDMGEA